MVKGQFKAILKKDLRLVFTAKTMLIIILVPFIMMFAIISLPALFIGTAETTITFYSADVGAIIPNYIGTPIAINLGDNAFSYIQTYVDNTSNLELVIAESREEALNASNGIFIPANFTSATFFNSSSKLEFHKSYSSASIQGVHFDTIINMIYEIVVGGFLYLNLEEAIPQFTIIEYLPPTGEPTGGWNKDTIAIAGPFSYALFIMVALIGNMGRTIGFSKEKEDGTFETMLTITKNRSHLVLSKLIVGVIASVMSILAYFAGSAFAGLITNMILGGNSEITSGLEGVLAIPFDALISFKGILILLGLGIGLVMTMLALMTFDTVFSKTVSERIGTSVVMGFGILFYFSIIFDPTSTAIYAQINPFYWIYHFIMALIDGSFGWIDGIFLGLTCILLAGLVYLATKAIEREKVLFT
ncbi:MAG: ABC transporter permease [Candidatus Thorarchaeota archaeon]